MKERDVMELGDLVVDLEARRITRGGSELQLGRLSFDLLAALLRSAPAALSSDDIVEEVWSGDFVTDETVKQRVSLLRRALGQEPGREYVETVRGFGYRLGMHPERPSPAEPRVPGPSFVPRSPARTALLILGIISLLLLITLLATAIRQVKRSLGPPVISSTHLAQDRSAVATSERMAAPRYWTSNFSSTGMTTLPPGRTVMIFPRIAVPLAPIPPGAS